ncbi:hypothetical protein [Paenibacillus sp. 481]|uniref:hypothetical protein n=1 Tax=Paenibacillus sp. 481 TaxID=2835869 RepID=UPI001E5CDA63|nr:hypothetical protein [Paenibacillus sp. 481]UHA75523.1 hypothetical protein KIK04_11320 [Paenibacillus sp. 481]
MRVWEVSSSSKSVRLSCNNWYVNSHIKDRLMFGKRVGELWTPVNFELYKEGLYEDLPHFISGMLIVPSHILNLLLPLIKDHVEVLPVTFNEEQHFIINVINVIDCNKNNELNYLKVKLDIEDSTKLSPIFKIPARLAVLVTDEFRDLVIEHSLEGFKFEEAWNSEVTNEMKLERKRLYEAKLAEIKNYPGKKYSFDEAMKMIREGKAVANGKNKLQLDENGELEIAVLQEEDCEYLWYELLAMPPMFLVEEWHEVDRED